jgi:HAMP domain-containing protein
MRIGAYVIGLTLVFTLSLVAIVANTFWSQYQQVMELFAIADPRTQWELVLNDIFLRNVGLVILLATGFVAAMTYVIFKITHRYYGPLVSIERFVDQVSVGDYSARVIIRKGDELQSLVRRLNQMAESIEKRHDSSKEGDQHAS